MSQAPNPIEKLFDVLREKLQPPLSLDGARAAADAIDSVAAAATQLVARTKEMTSRVEGAMDLEGAAKLLQVVSLVQQEIEMHRSVWKQRHERMMREHQAEATKRDGQGRS